MTVETPAKNSTQATAIDQLNWYITDAGDRRKATSALEFWHTRNEVLAAKDLLSAPAFAGLCRANILAVRNAHQWPSKQGEAITGVAYVCLLRTLFDNQTKKQDGH